MNGKLKHIVAWLSRKRVLLPALIFSFVLIGITLFWFVQQNKQLGKIYSLQLKLNNSENNFKDLFLLIQSIESDVRGYAATGDKRFVKNFDTVIDSISLRFNELKEFDANNHLPIDSQLATSFNSLLQQKISLKKQIKKLCDQGNRDSAIYLISSLHGFQLSDSILVIAEAKNTAIQTAIQKSVDSFINQNDINNEIAVSGFIFAILLTSFIVYLLFKEIGRGKRLSEEFRKQKEHFRTTLNSLGEGMISTNKKGEILYMNPAAERLTGWGWREAKKQPLQKVFNVSNEETGLPIENIVNRILKSGKIVQWENNTILRAKNADTFIISNNGAPLFDEYKNIFGAVLVFDDITEKDKIAKELIESEKKYRSLIEQASDAILVYSFDGTIHEFNYSARTLSGYTYEEFLKLNIKDLLIGELFLKSENKTAILAGKTVTLNRQFLRKDKKIIDLELTARLLDDDRILAFGRDSTERKKAEQEIVNSRKQFQNLVENISGVYWVNDLENYQTLYISPSYEKIWGRKCEDLYKNSADFINSIHPDDKSILFEVHKNIADTLKANISYRIIKPDGKIRWISARTNVVIDDNGHKIEYGYAEDITESKKAESALAESENRLRTIVQAEPECVKLLNIKGELEDMNPAGLAMIEADNLEQVKGKPVSDLINEPYRKSFDGLIKNVFEGISGILEFEITGLKETQRWLEIHAVPMKDAAGEIKSLLGVTRDITERKKTEEEIKRSQKQFQNLVENISGVYWITDLEINQTLYVSPFYETIRGSKPEELYNNQKDFINSIHPDDKEFFIDVYRNISETLKTNISYRIIKPSGEIRWISAKSKVFIDNNGHKIEYGYAEDITENKKAEEEIIEANKQLRLLSGYLQNIREEERKHMAREIHDELGQQLTIMKMDVSWLHKKLAESDEEVRQKTEELNEILNKTVITVRKIASELRPSVLDDMGLGAAIEWHLAEFEKRSGVKTEFDNMENELSLPDNVKTGLFRIVQESLTNVSRYANSKKVMVSLQLKEGNVTLKIKDNGEGFDKEKMAAKKTFGILGMKERTEMLGGLYEINSIPGQGTTVTVSVPYPVTAKK